MTDPNNDHSAAARTEASLSQRLHRLVVGVVTVFFGVTPTSLSFATASPSSPSHKGHSMMSPHTASPRPSSHASATAPKSKTKAKPAALQQRPQQRKTPAKTRVAAKSKAPTRAHPSPRKPSNLPAKQTKHSA